MLTGIYGYIFGSEESSSDMVSQENVDPCSDDWLMVEGMASGRSSPVIIPVPELRDIDTLSFASRKESPPPSAEAIQRADELRAAKALATQRMHLEKMLFADPDTKIILHPSSVSRTLTNSTSTTTSAGKLKRATAAAIVSSDSKTKSRSKKAGKMCSGRNNDRKVNNV